MPNIDDYVTFIGNEEDVIYLKRRAFPVNMRLFNTSEGYRDIVLSCCDYMKTLSLQEMDDYKKPHGMSGANAAIPFNIVAVVRSRGKEDEHCEILINPVITDASEEMKSSFSNCGSIRLEEPIEIIRHEWVDIEYYTTTGEKKKRRSRNATVQHEIDHNLGILITDRAKEIRPIWSRLSSIGDDD